MKTHTKAIWCIIVFAVTTALMFLLDYYDVFSRLGFIPTQLNSDFMSAVISNGIVVLLFALTFMLLDRRTVEKENNKRKVALLLLKSTYTHCLEIIERFADDEIRTAIATDSKKTGLGMMEPVRAIYRNIPFEETDEPILALAGEGVLQEHELEIYLSIKKKYKSHIELSYALYPSDKYSFLIPKRDELISLLNDSIAKINKESA